MFGVLNLVCVLGAELVHDVLELRVGSDGPAQTLVNHVPQVDQPNHQVGQFSLKFVHPCRLEKYVNKNKS